jgi:hypothetical protein
LTAAALKIILRTTVDWSGFAIWRRHEFHNVRVVLHFRHDCAGDSCRQHGCCERHRFDQHDLSHQADEVHVCEDEGEKDDEDETKERTTTGMGKLIGGKLVFIKAEMTSPTDPLLRIEFAFDCDGTDCGCSFMDEEGDPEPLPPHAHLVEWQEGAWTRVFAMVGNLPRAYGLHYDGDTDYE